LSRTPQKFCTYEREKRARRVEGSGYAFHPKGERGNLSSSKSKKGGTKKKRRPKSMVGQEPNRGVLA